MPAFARRLSSAVSLLCTGPALDSCEPDRQIASVPYPDRPGLLNFVIDAELCVACLACVRVCPTDAIAVVGEDEPLLLQVVDEACIRCGQCVPACPHDAVKVNGEIGRALAIASGGDGFLILSPESVAHFYPATPEQVINACYAAGFRAVKLQEYPTQTGRVI